MLNKINPKIYKIVIICLTIFLLFDILLTISSVNRAREADKGIPPSNGYERFLDNTFNSKYLKNMFNNNWSIFTKKIRNNNYIIYICCSSIR